MVCVYDKGGGLLICDFYRLMMADVGEDVEIYPEVPSVVRGTFHGQYGPS